MNASALRDRVLQTVREVLANHRDQLSVDAREEIIGDLAQPWLLDLTAGLPRAISVALRMFVCPPHNLTIELQHETEWVHMHCYKVVSDGCRLWCGTLSVHLLTEATRIRGENTFRAVLAELLDP